MNGPYATGIELIDRIKSDAPDTQVVTYQFESFTATWEHRQYAGNEAEKHNLGCYFYGTEGTFHMGWLDGWTFYPSNGKKAPIHQDPTLHEPDQQNIRELWADFLDEWFEGEALKGTKCTSGIIGTFLGPRSPGTG